MLGQMLEPMWYIVGQSHYSIHQNLHTRCHTDMDPGNHILHTPFLHRSIGRRNWPTQSRSIAMVSATTAIHGMRLACCGP